MRAISPNIRKRKPLAALAALATLCAAGPSAFGGGIGDFNGDGMDDVLLRHEDGQWQVHALDGRTRIADASGDVAIAADADLHFAGIGDLNGDGRHDVLLRRDDGSWQYYALDGTMIGSDSGAANLSRNLDYSIAGIGDFNGDGMDDVLLRHATGRWYFYPMDGGSFLRSGRGSVPLTRNRDWQLAGIGDFNGSGRDDVLLRHATTGRWYFYPLNGRRVIAGGRGSARLTRNLDWSVAGTGDFNGDGKHDVLLRHKDGRWYFYPMNGRQAMADGRGFVNLTRDLSWWIGGIGDFNGDGRDDLLLRHRDGRWFQYAMDGRMYLSGEEGEADLPMDRAWQLFGEIAFDDSSADDTDMDTDADDSDSSTDTDNTGNTLEPGSTLQDCTDCPEMVVIPAGSFQMGCLSNELGCFDDEFPVRDVTIAQQFAIGKYEVTFDQWDACVAAGGCEGYSPGDEDWGRGSRPVVNVNRQDAREYAQWLSETTGQSYRLPSEAQWEYAARGGASTIFHYGNSTIELCEYGNHADASTDYDWTNYSCNDGFGQLTAPVGSFQPNQFGLYDTIGNVWEWVDDCWNETYEGAPTDGSAWRAGDCLTTAIMRGGSWINDPPYARPAIRFDLEPTARGGLIGFRVVRTITQ